jgi:hypothetical protein
MNTPFIVGSVVSTPSTQSTALTADEQQALSNSPGFQSTDTWTTLVPVAQGVPPPVTVLDPIAPLAPVIQAGQDFARAGAEVQAGNTAANSAVQEQQASAVDQQRAQINYAQAATVGGQAYADHQASQAELAQASQELRTGRLFAALRDFGQAGRLERQSRGESSQANQLNQAGNQAMGRAWNESTSAGNDWAQAGTHYARAAADEAAGIDTLMGGFRVGLVNPALYPLNPSSVVGLTYYAGVAGLPSAQPSLNVQLQLPPGVSAWGTSDIVGNALVLRLAASGQAGGGNGGIANVQLPVPPGMSALGPRNVIIEDAEGNRLAGGRLFQTDPTVPLSQLSLI